MELFPAIILAGGLATRMRPITERIPKALIEIAGEPFLSHQLKLLRRNGIRKFVLAVGYLGEKIQDRFGDGSDLGVQIDYSFDGPVLQGTAGAIRQALPLLPDSFFVLYGDSYLLCDYQAVQAKFQGAALPGLMTVYRNAGLYDKSNVEYRDGRILQYDKQNPTPRMLYIDYGLGVFSRDVFAELESAGPHDLATTYQELLKSGKLSGFEVSQRFYEIGSPAGLQETTALLEASKRNCSI